ncbi:MAG TPA: CPBP family intramembrane glutamic endopeptidase [Vicinamibacterales bacterium]|nr:CPBP family intramembrane glutamic endopeptidase [Vicinamibacterales bacterium]
MSPRRILAVALVTQAGLIALAWWAASILNLPPRWGHPWRDALIGCVVALALGVTNHLLLTRAPSNWVTDGVRRVYRETIVPLFRGLSPWGVIAIGAAAGIGEEWVFRGIVQPVAGMIVASLLFGLAHVGSVRMLAFGVWAAMMGLIMGTLAMITGGLTAPMVAHGVYDMLALEYIRRGARSE